MAPLNPNLTGDNYYPDGVVVPVTPPHHGDIIHHPSLALVPERHLIIQYTLSPYLVRPSRCNDECQVGNCGRLKSSVAYHLSWSSWALYSYQPTVVLSTCLSSRITHWGVSSSSLLIRHIVRRGVALHHIGPLSSSALVRPRARFRSSLEAGPVIGALPLSPIAPLSVANRPLVRESSCPCPPTGLWCVLSLHQ